MEDVMLSSTEIQIEEVVYALAASPTFAQDQLCFAARQSGLYRSTDGGLTWQSAYESLNLDTPLITMTVVFSPDFEADRSVFAGAPGGVLRSIDAGLNWEAVMLPSPPPAVSSLVVSPNFANDSVLLAGTLEDGVFRSADGGRHWASWNFGLLDLNTLALAISPDFANDETLFIGTDSGIFRSTNGGRAWRELDLPVGFEPVLSLAISPGYATDGTLFAGTESRGLFRSGDRGRTWARLGEDVLADAINAIILAPDFPSVPDLLVLHNDELLISRDGGQSWVGRQIESAVDQDVIAVVAPQGLVPAAPLLAGRVTGEIVRGSI